jgi:hypothetical protein
MLTTELGLEAGYCILFWVTLVDRDAAQVVSCKAPVFGA